MVTLVRKGPAEPALMADRLLNKMVARTERRFGKKQSDAYRWLHARHRDLAATFVKHPPIWPDLADIMAAAGILGGRGRPLTGQAVRRIWDRVCRDMQVAAVIQRSGPQAQARKRVSAPANWQPKPVPAVAAAPSPAPPEVPVERPGLLTRIGRSLVDRSPRPVEQHAEVAPATDPAPLALPREGGPLTPEQVRAMKADLQRTLDERSGR